MALMVATAAMTMMIARKTAGGRGFTEIPRAILSPLCVVARRAAVEASRTCGG
jgi:hypothetical protein